MLIYLEPESRNIHRYGIYSNNTVTTKLGRLPYNFSGDGWRQNTVAWCLIDENTIFLAGGDDGENRRSDTFKFDFKNNHFEKKANMLKKR